MILVEFGIGRSIHTATLDNGLTAITGASVEEATSAIEAAYRRAERNPEEGGADLAVARFLISYHGGNLIRRVPTPFLSAE